MSVSAALYRKSENGLYIVGYYFFGFFSVHLLVPFGFDFESFHIGRRGKGEKVGEKFSEFVFREKNRSVELVDNLP